MSTYQINFIFSEPKLNKKEISPRAQTWEGSTFLKKINKYMVILIVSIMFNILFLSSFSSDYSRAILTEFKI